MLAGEYPGGPSLAATTERVQRLLGAGVTLFVDLTVEHELDAYHRLFDYVSMDVTIKHVREPIRDHGIPDNMAAMQRVLAAINEHIDAGGIVYVHCRAGIGRTGVTVACHLVQSGLRADEALDRLNELWCECDRARTWPSVPETEEQVEFVHRFAEHLQQTKRNTPTRAAAITAASPLADRYQGALLGLAIGDALGAAAAIGSPRGRSPITDMSGGGPLAVPPGAWLADTSMTLALLDSLLSTGRNDAQDQMERYLRWQREGAYASTATALAVPAELRRALAQWQWSKKPIAGSHDPNNRDGHALARTTAVALVYSRDATLALHEAGEAARPTIQSPIVVDACRAYAAALVAALNGSSKSAVVAFGDSDAARMLRQRRLKPEVLQVIDGEHDTSSVQALAGMDESLAASNDDVLNLLSVALWAFDRSDHFAQGALLAVNASESPASAGAVYGALAGAHYGAQALPEQWRATICRKDELSTLAERCLARATE